MKIIDQTPFINHETGEISMLDRGRAIMKYGNIWLKEIAAQAEIIPVMSKVLDRNYTLLRNVLLPDLGTTLPFILVGPAGVFVMYVTPLTGTYRAKGDQWGTISGSSFRDEKPNLMTRTERMARALQVYLQHQGNMDLITVEPVLLCSDPSVHIDSLRPIIRVVMRDALERLLISISQSRVSLSPENVLKVVDRIVNPPQPVQVQPEVAAPEPDEPPFAIPEEDLIARAAPAAEPVPPLWTDVQASPFVAEPQDTSQVAQQVTPEVTSEVPPELVPEIPPKATRGKGLNRKQVVFLVVVFAIWLLLVAIFVFFVVRDQFSTLTSLLP